jgi:HD-GYP domain-containing protein (c-di-GMP phosphodiesterase class II)
MGCPRIVLAGVSPRLRGLEWEFETALRIGRHESSDIVLQHNSVSHRHAEVFARNNQWLVRDLARSKHQPTLVNGRSVGVAEVPLRSKDILQCGSMELEVRESGESALAPQPQRPEVLVAVPPSLKPLVSAPGHHIKTTGSFLRIDATARRSWDQALQVVTEKRDDDHVQQEHLFTLLRAGHHLCHISALDELLESILADAVAALKAQRGAILLADPHSGELNLRTVLAPKLPSRLQRCYSRTMADRSYALGESLLCSDVNAEAELQSARSVRVGTMASLICALLRSPRKHLGVLHLDRGPNQMPFDENDFHLADAIAASVAIGIESAQLVEEQRDQFVQTVTSLARAVEVRDFYTGNHTRRVTDYALLLADELRVSGTERYHIHIGTPLHDIGKIGIDDAILRKPDRLTTAEFEHMKLHTVKGAAILESIYALNPVIPIVRHHHERWDGKGYPDGLANEQISRTARIVAVADAFDAMTSDRPYRKALSTGQAFAELVAKAGSHFDPTCVQAFIRLRPYVERLVLEK